MKYSFYEEYESVFDKYQMKMLLGYFKAKYARKIFPTEIRKECLRNQW
jgi:hypothetical protein